MTNYRQTMADTLKFMHLMHEYKLMERELTDTEKKRREEIAQDMDDADFKERYGDRWKEVKMAVATNQAKNEKTDLDEKTKWKMGDGRPRGGSHIENVRFWDLSKDELQYIMKDAGEAMKANPTGRKAISGPGNYADQVNDAQTVLVWRKKNGIKEEVELDEAKPEYEVKYAERKNGPIKVTKFMTLDQAKKFLAQVEKEGMKGIISMDGKPVKEEIEEGDKAFTAADQKRTRAKIALKKARDHEYRMKHGGIVKLLQKRKEETELDEATGKEIAAKMMKDRSMKAFASKVAKMKTVSRDDLEKMLPDYVSGGAITKLFEELELDEARQLKNPKKEVMVVKSGKVIVIDKKDAKEYLNKGWDLAEEVELDEDNMDLMRKAAKGAAQTLKMKDGNLKMDSFTASGIIQVYDGVNPKNKIAMEKMINTGKKSAIVKLQSLAMKASKGGSRREEVELDEWTVSDVEIAMKKKYGKVDKEAIEKLKKIQHRGNVVRNDLVKVGHGKLHVESVGESARSDAMRAIRKDKDLGKGSDVDGDDDSATDVDIKGASKNILMQMRKALNLGGKFEVEFLDKKKVKIKPAIANAFIKKYENMRRPADKEKFQNQAMKSYKSMLSALKENTILDRIDKKIQERKNG